MRTTGFCDIPLFLRLFHEALVVHVDLSVLIWFLSIACMFWSMLARGSALLSKAAQTCFILGMIFISISPADPNGVGVMSNYIPVIMSPLFFLGLSLLLCGTCLMLTDLFINSSNQKKTPHSHQPLGAVFLVVQRRKVGSGSFKWTRANHLQSHS